MTFDIGALGLAQTINPLRHGDVARPAAAVTTSRAMSLGFVHLNRAVQPGVGLRALAAVFVVVYNLALIWAGGNAFVHRPFNHAPNQVVLVTPEYHPDVPNWDRLLVSRWDSGRFIRIAHNGFAACPRQATKMSPEVLAYIGPRCDFLTFPGYAYVGRWLSLALNASLDWVLLAVSVASTLALAFLWTSRAVTEAVGERIAWMSLLLLATFPSAIYLVSIYSESLTMALLMGGFVAYRRRRWLLTGALIGAATAVRHIALGAALGFGIATLLDLVNLYRRPGRLTVGHFVHRSAAVALSIGGYAFLTWFWWNYYRDPLLWLHAAGGGPAAAGNIWTANALFRGFRTFQYDGALMVMVALLVLAGLGTLRVRLSPSERAFMVCQALSAFMIPLTNALGGEFWGFNRYWLLVFPAFFLLASTLIRSPAALIGWLGFSAVYVWNVELCFYLTRNQLFGVCPCLNK